MQVNLIVVIGCIDTGLETLLLERVGFHYASLNCLLYLVIEFLNRADAQFITLIIAPYGQRSTPVTAAAQVPVIQVLKPLSETACTG